MSLSSYIARRTRTLFRDRKLTYTFNKPFDVAVKLKTQNAERPGDLPGRPTMLPEQDAIISVFSDSNYMQGLYNQMLFIKAMSRQEAIA